MPHVKVVGGSERAQLSVRFARSMLVRSECPGGAVRDARFCPPDEVWRRAWGYVEGLEDGGLISVCLKADFKRQFEVVQAQWCDDGPAFLLGSDKHCLLGDSQGMGEVTIQGHPLRCARAQPLVLLTHGCVYLLMPRGGALRDLPGR